MRIDAHTHTTCSDGVVSIEERMNMIRSCGYEAGTITDHDFISEEQVHRAKSSAPDILYIPGIELTTVHMEKTVHILGYFVDPTDSGLARLIRSLDEREYEITHRMMKTIDSKWHIHIEESELGADSIHTCHYLRLIRAVSRNTSFSFPKTLEIYYGALAEIGLNWNSFFDCDVKGAIDLIHHAGGIAVLAHPGFENDPTMQKLGFLDHDFCLFEKYKAWGLDGVESHCPSHSEQQSLRFKSWADSLGLLNTEGSDCHGEDPSLGPSLIDKFKVWNEHGVEDMVERLHVVQG